MVKLMDNSEENNSVLIKVCCVFWKILRFITETVQICKYSIKARKLLDLRGHQLIGADEFVICISV
jgi:hypothetical protein